MAFPQSFDEIGQADLALAAQPLCAQDRAHAFHTGIDVVVDDDVVIFRPMAHLVGGLGHPPRHDIGTVLGAGMQAPLQFPC